MRFFANICGTYLFKCSIQTAVYSLVFLRGKFSGNTIYGWGRSWLFDTKLYQCASIHLCHQSYLLNSTCMIGTEYCMIGTETMSVCVSESIPNIVRINRKAFFKQRSNIIEAIYEKKETVNAEGLTPHADFVNFSFRGSLVWRNTNDVLPMEKSWNLIYGTKHLNIGIYFAIALKLS